MKKILIFLAILSSIDQLQSMNVYQEAKPTVNSVKQELYFFNRTLNNFFSVSVAMGDPIEDNKEKLDRLSSHQEYLNSLNSRIAQLPEAERSQFSDKINNFQNLINSNRTVIVKTLDDLKN